MLQNIEALFMVTAVFPVHARSDAVVLVKVFMVRVSGIAVFPETPEGVHTKYSVNKQQVNKCTGRASLSKMAALCTQQLYPYSRGK